MASTDCIDIVAVLKEEWRTLRGRTEKANGAGGDGGGDQGFIETLSTHLNELIAAIEPGIRQTPSARAALADLKAIAAKPLLDMSEHPDPAAQIAASFRVATRLKTDCERAIADLDRVAARMPDGRAEPDNQVEAAKQTEAGKEDEARQRAKEIKESVQRFKTAVATFKERVRKLEGEREQNAYSRLHARERWALCLSGGGIRSATFGLGVLEGLAAKGILNRFDYLSTVSGGGYIGSWLSAWCHHRHGDFRSVVEFLANAAKENSERTPIRHLRDYSNYLTPKLGVLSADTWTTIATYARNLVLNWLVLIPLLMAVLLMPQIGMALVSLPLADVATLFGVSRPETAAWWVFGLGGVSLVRAMIFVGLNRPSASAARGREPKGQRAFLWRCLLPVMIAAICFSLSWAWLSRAGWRVGDLSIGKFDSIWTFALAGGGLRVLAWLFSLKSYGVGDANSDRAWEVVIAFVTGAIGGVLTWCVASLLSLPARSNDPVLETVLVCLLPPFVLLIFLASEIAYVGLASKLTSDEDREWWGRAGGWVLVAGLAWMALRIIVLIGPVGIGWAAENFPKWLGAMGGVSGVVTVLIGKSGLTAAKPSQEPPSGIAGYLTGPSLAVAATVFIVMLLAVLAAVNNQVLYTLSGPFGTLVGLGNPPSVERDFCVIKTAFHLDVRAPALCRSHAIPLLLVLAAIAVLVGLALIVAYFVNVNRFSLHAMYRARLIRAYLGASNPNRHPHPFTGFDEKDNLGIHALYPRKIENGRQAEDKRSPRDRPPFHVVNVALNLVSGHKLAWQERKAEAFTLSPLHCGSAELGFRPSGSYGGQDGISLGTALTISGAAASPNMGYHSSPLVMLIMLLFNARLGWWLGNPGPRGDPTFHLDGPRLAFKPLIAEAFGLTDDENRYVYLSDGGHFENLGLYEMVRRRCRVIVVSDAGCDPKFQFDDLGNALRKIRIDLGVEIHLPERPKLYKWADEQGSILCNPQAPYAAIGTIRYPEGNKGLLIYLKPAVHGDEPTDVLNYRATHDSFPHESTSDQWFSESQFESYRRLGLHIAAKGLESLSRCEDPDVRSLAAELQLMPRPVVP